MTHCRPLWRRTAGFEAAYLSGASVAYTLLGRPDIGLVSLTEVADTVARIRDRVDLPLVVDADTGWVDVTLPAVAFAPTGLGAPPSGRVPTTPPPAATGLDDLDDLDSLNFDEADLGSARGRLSPGDRRASRRSLRRAHGRRPARPQCAHPGRRRHLAHRGGS